MKGKIWWFPGWFFLGMLDFKNDVDGISWNIIGILWDIGFFRSHQSSVVFGNHMCLKIRYAESPEVRTCAIYLVDVPHPLPMGFWTVERKIQRMTAFVYQYFNCSSCLFFLHFCEALLCSWCLVSRLCLSIGYSNCSWSSQKRERGFGRALAFGSQTIPTEWIMLRGW